MPTKILANASYITFARVNCVHRVVPLLPDEKKQTNKQLEGKHSNTQSMIILLMFIPVNAWRAMWVENAVFRLCGRKKFNAMFNCWNSTHAQHGEHFENWTNVLDAPTMVYVTPYACVFIIILVEICACGISSKRYILLPSPLVHTLAHTNAIGVAWCECVWLHHIVSSLLHFSCERNDYIL